MPRGNFEHREDDVAAGPVSPRDPEAIQAGGRTRTAPSGKETRLRRAIGHKDTLPFSTGS